MKIMFSAGEASGDTHAASVAAALKELYPDAKMIGMGGSKMKAAGVEIVYDIDNLGYIGIVEIVKALPKFFELRTFLKNIMIKERPDVFVCVDYPGFNMKMAKVAHELKIPVVYYIAPTIWAWHKSRGKDIAKYTTKVASIFPFEAKAYEEFNADVAFVGNPLVDTVKPKRSYEEDMEYYKADKDAFKILLMPGSRKQEVNGLLEDMLQAMESLKGEHEKLQFFLPRAHTIPMEMLKAKIDEHDLDIIITEDDVYDVMQICDAAIAASGTATLETALMNLPTILVYKVAQLTYMIANMVLNIPYVGLPNIVAQKEVIPELLQKEANPKRIAMEMTKLIEDKNYYMNMKNEMAQIKEKLGAPGAVARVAQLVAEVASSEECNEQ